MSSCAQGWVETVRRASALLLCVNTAFSPEPGFLPFPPMESKPRVWVKVTSILVGGDHFKCSYFSIGLASRLPNSPHRGGHSFIFAAWSKALSKYEFFNAC
jgi:hypothetical protein